MNITRRWVVGQRKKFVDTPDFLLAISGNLCKKNFRIFEAQGDFNVKDIPNLFFVFWNFEREKI